MKVLTVIDEFTREALAVVPARSMTASALKGVLAKLFATRGRPTTITSDNGPELIAFGGPNSASGTENGAGPGQVVRTGLF